MCQVLRFRGEGDRLAHEKSCGGAAGYSVEEIPLVVRGANSADAVGGRAVGGSERGVIELQSSDDEGDDGAIQKVKPGPSSEASNQVVKSESIKILRPL